MGQRLECAIARAIVENDAALHDETDSAISGWALHRNTATGWKAAGLTRPLPVLALEQATPMSFNAEEKCARFLELVFRGFGDQAVLDHQRAA